jgi:energy-converting hydrogenase B subunit D
MIARWILLALLPIVATIALTQSRRLSAIIGMGLFSFMLAAVYLLMHAPDVALTEATMSAALVTAIYVLAIRKTGRLTVVADEVPGLIAREGSHIAGLEYDLLSGFARELGLDLSVQFVPLRRVPRLVAHHEADMGAGGIVLGSSPDCALSPTARHLDTGVYVSSADREVDRDSHSVPDYEGYFSDLVSQARSEAVTSTIQSLDLARVLALTRSGAQLQDLRRLDEPFGYAFWTARDRADLREDYDRYLDGLRASGKLDELIRRHFP